MTPTDPARPEPIGPLTEADTAALLASAPPMRGAEYLSPRVLGEFWQLLDDWVRDRIRDHDGLAAFLKKKAPQWHQVGRVCFHLAENKGDSEYPFAFMATYAPELSGRGRARHQPLNQALREYAGARNKPALIRLLSPVQRASDSSALIRELVETGDLYHPLAWTSAEAYAFLKETSLYEQSGVLVRLPDWWKKRSRPRVGVTIGGGKQKDFGLDSLLDFKMQVALGDETLSQAELRELMQAGDGLVLLKGQWVEVDQAKLAAALEHWKQVEAGTTGAGLSFVEGMRLLAGAPADLSHGDAEEVEREWSFVRPGRWLESLLAELRAPGGSAAARPGRALNATLRPYQEAGVEWLALLSQLGLGACLADDMGLGKTIQIIALLLVLKKKRRGQALPAGASGISARQLAVRTRTLCTFPEQPVRAFIPGQQASAAGHGGGWQCLPERGGCGIDHLRDAVAPALAPGTGLAAGGIG